MLNIFLHIFPQWKSTVLDYSIYREYFFWGLSKSKMMVSIYCQCKCWYTSQFFLSMVTHCLFDSSRWWNSQCSPCFWLQRGPKGSGPAWRMRRVSTPCSRSNPSPRCHRDWYLQWLFIFHMYIIIVLSYSLYHIYILYFYYYYYLLLLFLLYMILYVIVI